MVIWYSNKQHAVWPPGLADTPLTLTFDLETGARVASKGSVTLKRNETEPGGMNNFQNSSHIRAGMSFLKEFSKNAVRIGLLRICCEPASNDSCTLRVYLSNADRM